jgi:hypothetical protein
MARHTACLLWIGICAFSAAHAQTPQQIIQQVVETQHDSDEQDHSQWLYLEKICKPKEQVVQRVASTPQGEVQLVLERNGEKLTASQQSDLIRDFLHDPWAQKKQVSEMNHDMKQLDDLLQLLPHGFVWTQTDANATTTFLHFEPNPHFRPPTREARVFSSMEGDAIIDNQQHRIQSMRGHLMHEVRFGGGILGKLKQGGSFSLQQEQVGPSLWQLTAFDVHLEGDALLFKSISLLQDDERSDFRLEPSTITLDQAATEVMSQTETARF